MKFSRKTDALWLISLFIFISITLLISKSDSFVALEKALQVSTVPEALLKYGSMGDILRKLQRVEFTRNDFQRFAETENKNADIQTITFQKKRQVGDHLLLANSSGNIKYTSTEIAKSLLQKPNWPIISIHIDEKSLHDPEKGILPNRDRKGRDWERLAEVSYIENGEMVFETYVGLRMHGGIRLTHKDWAPGFRLYFREIYGLENIPFGKILPEQEVPLRTLVLQTTVWPPGHPMNNPLAYDIARKIGCRVPATRLVEVYVNGKSQGMGYAVEHLSRRQWGQRYERNDYNFLKFRSNNFPEDEAMYSEKFWTTVTAEEELSAEYVAATIDLDNFSRHIFSWVFCATTDYCQGVAVYNNQDPQSKVSWINWDMDHSFYDLEGVESGSERENWQQEAFSMVYKKRHTCGRTTLFSRLMNESDEYRLEFLNLVIELLNHSLTNNYLESRVTYYKEMMNFYGEPHHDYATMLEDFVAHRTDFILNDIQTQFSVKGLSSCRISTPAGATVLVDGYPYENDYRGRYFTDTPVRVALPASDQDRLRHWVVNGRKITDKTLSLNLREDTDIRCVLDKR